MELSHVLLGEQVLDDVEETEGGGELGLKLQKRQDLDLDLDKECWRNCTSTLLHSILECIKLAYLLGLALLNKEGGTLAAVLREPTIMGTRSDSDTRGEWERRMSKNFLAVNLVSPRRWSLSLY